MTTDAQIPAPATDLVAHRILFDAPATWVDQELYFTVHGTDGHDGGVDDAGRTSVTLLPNTLVAADTYFGRFRASYWQRWTNVPSVTLRATVDPGVRMIACGEDIGGHVRHAGIAEVPADADGPRDVAIEVKLDMFADGGAIYPAFRTRGRGGRVRDARVTVDAAHVVRDLSTDIVICTYNRPVDCAHTAATLAGDPEAMARVRAVRIVDQGDRHPEDEAEFEAAREVFGDRLQLVRQPNLGGAGGFSRGMRDAVDAGDCLVLLTDDDIRPEPETTLRLSALACCTANPTLIGAQMLFLYNPTYLFRSGETHDWDHLTVHLNDPEHGDTDVDVRENPQLRRLGVDYNAWWSCLVPSEVIEDIGLALPLFFQYDDIDFGYRAAEAGYHTITLPGAGVWHADFYWKDVDSPTGYFSVRNGLIGASLHGGDPVELVKSLGRMIGSNLVSMRYGLAAAQIQAIRDMLSGPSVLDDASVGDFARAGAIRNAHPGTELLPMTAIPGNLRPARPPSRDISSVDKVLAKRAAYTQLGKKRPGPVAVAYEDAFWWHIATFDEVWVTDGSQSGVRHLVRDRDRELAMRGELLTELRNLKSRWEDVAGQWRAAAPGLSSPANWARHFEG